LNQKQQFKNKKYQRMTVTAQKKVLQFWKKKSSHTTATHAKFNLVAMNELSYTNEN